MTTDAASTNPPTEDPSSSASSALPPSTGTNNLTSQQGDGPSSTRTSYTRVDHDDATPLPHNLDATPPTAPETTSTGTDSVPTPSPHLLAPIAQIQSSLPPTTTTTMASQEPRVDTEENVPATATAATETETTPTPPADVVPAPTPAPEPVPQTPQTYLSFLLISGRRRTMNFDPETTIGRVKELVWNSWPTDWQDERPPAPSYLRVLYLGRMLQDDETLTKLKLPTHTTPAPANPTIMHISIRPSAPATDDAVKKKNRRRGTNDESEAGEPDEQTNGAGCCQCVIC